MDNNLLIEEIERLNKDYYEIINSSQYISGHNLQKFKGEGLPGLISSLIRRRAFSKVKQYPAAYNLPPEKEKELARFGDKNKRVVVYTCVTNGYDTLSSPYIEPDNSDYVFFF